MVGLTAAVIGSAVIGAGASAIGASKNSKAIRRAQQAQTDSNTQSVALQRDIYSQNKSALSPFLERGNKAGDAYNALLGLGGPAPVVGSALTPYAGQNWGMPPGYFGGRGFGDGVIERQMMEYGQPSWQPEYAPQAAAPQPNALEQQRAAFDQFRNSTGYNFRLGEGNNGINSAYAAAGTLRSGAAMKALARFNQDYASNEFGNYMNMLGGQQNVGLSAGSALAGVGQSFANNVTALNGQQANNISNAAVARANNTNSMIGGITSSFGNALGIYGQSKGWFR